jgi:hypothetical protein
MTHQKIYDHFIEQAGWNEMLGSPYTAAILRHMADDLIAGGPIKSLCEGWPGNPRKDALGLRVLGVLHHATLTGHAPALAAAFPAQNANYSADETWPIARDWLSANIDHVHAFMQRPPQTNETRRAIALLPGFLELAATFNTPMHLLELGASAGLNQNWDRFNYKTDTWSYAGNSDVTISTDWHGPAPQYLDAKPNIQSRAACDQTPLIITDKAEALRLKAYTWPDQSERLARLDAAVALALDAKTQVDAADAEDWLRDKLANRPKTGLTVIYHSVFLIYPPRDKIERIMSLIKEAGDVATQDNPLAWLCYESEALFGGDRGTPAMQTRLQTWPKGHSKIMAQSDGHVTRITALDT